MKYLVRLGVFGVKLLGVVYFIGIMVYAFTANLYPWWVGLMFILSFAVYYIFNPEFKKLYNQLENFERFSDLDKKIDSQMEDNTMELRSTQIKEMYDELCRRAVTKATITGILDDDNVCNIMWNWDRWEIRFYDFTIVDIYNNELDMHFYDFKKYCETLKENDNGSN